jgi:hypothetical protein
LHCASPEQLGGKSWDVIEDFCLLVGGPSVLTTTLTETRVLLICSIGGGLILAKVLKRLRKRPKASEYCDVYAPKASHISVHSYAEIVASRLTSQIDFMQMLKGRHTSQFSHKAIIHHSSDIRPSYITVQS